MRDQRRRASGHNREQLTAPQPTVVPQPVPQAPVTTITFEGRTLQYSSPVPPPEILAAYNQVSPDLANRIMSLAEDQTHHRISIEAKAIDRESKRSGWGLFSATLIGLTGMVSAAVVGYSGHEWAAVGIVGSLSTVYGGAFIYGTKSRREERMDKAKLMTGHPPN